MFHLIYASKEKQEFTAADLKNLLVTSRILNRQVDVTGILVYQTGMFLQALEGEEEAVQSTFARIEKDVRHGEFTFCITTHRSTNGACLVNGQWDFLMQPVLHKS